MARYRRNGSSAAGDAGRSWAWRRAGDAVILLAGIALALPLIALGG